MAQEVRISLKYDSSNSIFGPNNREMWRKMRTKAVAKGAYELKERVKQQFKSQLPAADKPLTSKFYPTPGQGKKWKGKLIDTVIQYKPDVTEDSASTAVSILSRRKSGYGDFIGLFYNKGNFRTPDRTGPKTVGRGKNKQTNKNYHKRGNLPALDYLAKGTKGFNFTATVDEILKSYIEQIS